MSVTCGRSVVFSTNNTDRHDITEMLLKVALNTINQPTTTKWYDSVITMTRLKYVILSLWLVKLSWVRKQSPKVGINISSCNLFPNPINYFLLCKAKKNICVYGHPTHPIFQPPTLTFLISNYWTLIFASDPINFYIEFG